MVCRDADTHCRENKPTTILLERIERMPGHNCLLGPRTVCHREDSGKSHEQNVRFHGWMAVQVRTYTLKQSEPPARFLSRPDYYSCVRTLRLHPPRALKRNSPHDFINLRRHTQVQQHLNLRPESTTHDLPLYCQTVHTDRNTHNTLTSFHHVSSWHRLHASLGPQLPYKAVVSARMTFLKQ
jgi:hypothetical protein